LPEAAKTARPLHNPICSAAAGAAASPRQGALSTKRRPGNNYLAVQQEMH
jgi:hypothetical protein